MDRSSDVDGISAILGVIRARGHVGRPELQRLSGLGRGAVSQRVSQLLELSVVAEADFGPSTGGRAARELRLRSEAGRLLVGYASLTELDLGVADLSGRLLTSHRERCDFDAGPERMISRAKFVWKDMVESLGSTPTPVWGMGLGIPAHVDFASGRLIDSPSLPSTWRGCDIRQDLSEFGASVWVETDDNLLALGELRSGAALGETSIIYLFADMVVGAGLILDGRLYRGHQGAAGNIGHISSGGAAVCRCGRRGCVEAVAGGEALLREAVAFAQKHPEGYFAAVLGGRGRITLEDIGEGVRQGDAHSRDLISASGDVIGRALAATVNILNPSIVLVGGRLTQTGDVFLSSLKEALLRHSLPFVTRELRILRVEDTGSSGLKGAAHMIMDQLFSPAGLADWIPSGSPAGRRTIGGQ